ncbi:MAG TPA: ThiF family adenylyltransferase [Gemmatimonadaceae bacterium]|nr:ThiF family adenylyltransferase [Gemmatimonadaceae bacterium]
MLLVAASNLLSRWCRDVRIVMPDVDVLPALGMGAGRLGDLILAQMRDADPFGEFRVLETDAGAADLTLAIGADARTEASSSTIFVNASGWLAGIARHAPLQLAPANDSNLLGAIAAACLGVGQLFKLAIGMPAQLLARDGIFDLFSLDWTTTTSQAPWPDATEIGKLLMVGAGSVGSAAVYCLRATGLSGAITIVDGDTVKVENFNRSPLFGRKNFGLAKAAVLEGWLAGSRFAATSVRGWWDDFLRQTPRPSFDYDIWLPLANEYNVRASMQHNVPPLMIYASTTQNWGVNHGRHIPGRDDCLVERFPVPVTARDLKCSTAPIQVAEETVDAALPFASTFAGLLAAADLVRSHLPGYPQIPSFALLDWYGPLDLIQRADRKRDPACPTCSGQGRTFHERLNSSTKYRYLFRL